MNDVACVLTLDFAFRHGCPLRSLDLDDNGLGRDGARALACALASEACALERLEVRHEKRKKRRQKKKQTYEKKTKASLRRTLSFTCVQSLRPPLFKRPALPCNPFFFSLVVPSPSLFNWHAPPRVINVVCVPSSEVKGSKFLSPLLPSFGPIAQLEIEIAPCDPGAQQRHRGGRV